MRHRAGHRAGHRVRRWAGLGTAAAIVLAGVAAVALTTTAHADDVTVSSDAARTGWDQSEPSLSASSVAGSNFGQLFDTAVNGQVYAQPVVVGSTVIVATENNYVYGLDSVTGTIKWSESLGPAWPVSTLGCGDLTPNIGITSTPVYDPSSGYIYLTAKTNDGADAAHPHYYLHALNATTGAERTGWPVSIGGKPSNDTTTTFDPEHEMQRPGLLLMDGSIYLGFGAHCDINPYRGYVVGVNTSTKSQHLWTTEAGTGSAGSGIWQSGGGLVSDGPGRIIVATGNGIMPPVSAGTSAPKTLSESVVRLSVASDGTISTADYFSPADADTLDANDSDLGSGAPTALPSEFGTASFPHLLVQAGKDGRVFLLNRDNLGGRGQGTNGGDAVVGVTGPFHGFWSHPAAYGGDGGYVYMTQNNGPMLALKYGVTGSGLPALSVAGTTAKGFGYTSGSPVVTSDGTTSGSGLVWMVGTSGPTGDAGTLMVYQAVPANGVLPLVRSFPLGTVSKFEQPATSGGRVYVGTRDGHLFGFGAPTTQALTASPANFGNVETGSSQTDTVTLTATQAVTVSAVTAAAPFSAGATTPAATVTLAKGDTISVPVTFTPSGPGSVTGELDLTTDAGTIAVGLTGTGVQPGLQASPSPLAFGELPTGSTETLAVSIQNTDTNAETITGVTSPTAPFTVSGLPANGTALAGLASLTISVTYTPTVAENDAQNLVVTGSAGSVTVPLTGDAVTGVRQMTVTPTTLDFGSVPIGQSASLTITFSNTGNLPLTIDKAAPPAAPFSVPNPLPEGVQISPGDEYVITVTYIPTALGAVSGVYDLTSDTGAGPQNVTITGTGAPPASATYTPDGPVRVLDTRFGLGRTGSTAPIAGGGTISLPIAGVDGVPTTGVTAVVMNVTVTQPTGTGYLTVYPDGQTTPNASNLNWTAGETIANLVTVPVIDGTVDFHNTSGGSVHVVADLVGYYGTAAGGSGYTPDGPVRMLDTRTATGVTTKTPVVSNGTTVLTVTGVDNVPSNATAAVLNVTVTAPSGTGYLTVYPDGQTTPNASNLNWTAGETIANLVIVPLVNGKVDLHNTGAGTVHFIADLVGYFAPGGGAQYTADGPVRALDTRTATGVTTKTPVAPNGTVVLTLGGTHGVPSNATAAVLNVTVTQPTGNGYLTIYGDGKTMPNASNLNWVPGETIPNEVVAPIVNGKIDFHNTSGGTVHVIADLIGYYTN